MAPQLHLICGLPGAGKTTLGLQLMQESGCHRFCPDEWIAELLADHSDRAEMDRLRGPVEAIQRLQAMSLLRKGVDVVLENGFWSREERISYLEEGRSLGAEVTLHFLDVPVDVLKARIEGRNQDLPHGTFRVEPHEIERWFALLEPPDDEEARLYSEYQVVRGDER